MIRFICAHCAKPLRAPDAMAGKKGRCAQCNGVNLVPVITAVDVKRVTAPTPFRDADVPVRGAIERVVELSGGVRFAAATPATATVVDERGRGDAQPGDFFDQIAPHLGRVAEDFDPDVHPSPRHQDTPPRAPARDAVHYERVRPEPVMRYEAVQAAAAAAVVAAHVRRAVIAAIVVGAILGFCAGLLASKWIL
jgi:hypothetical protein